MKSALILVVAAALGSALTEVERLYIEGFADDGMSTAEFADDGNFPGWNFEENARWVIADDAQGVPRPRLIWEFEERVQEKLEP